MYIAIGITVGWCFLFLCMWASSVLGINPVFPAYAGEDDFQLRTIYFLVTLFPGFTLIGGYIGWSARSDSGSILPKSVGVFVGTVLFFLILMGAASVIETIETRSRANLSVLFFYSLWLTFVVIGAVGAKKKGEKTS